MLVSVPRRIRLFFQTENQKLVRESPAFAHLAPARQAQIETNFFDA
jgi:hypothetical protein